MRTVIAATAALALTSGCVADGLASSRTYRTTPRSEARWIIAGGLGEALLGVAMVAGGIHSLENPEPKDPVEPVDIGGAAEDFAAALAAVVLGGVLVLAGAADDVAGLYQLAGNDFLIGESYEPD